MIRKVIIKVIKAIMFFGVAITFSTLRFYDIDLTIIHPLTNESLTITSSTFLMQFWSDVFEVQGLTWVLVIFFAVLGVLEILEVLEMIKHE